MKMRGVIERCVVFCREKTGEYEHVSPGQRQACAFASSSAASAKIIPIDQSVLKK